MMAAPRIARLVDRLPRVRGRLSENAPLSGMTWFRVGGPAEVLFQPADRDDLIAFLAARPADVPVTIVGLGSNLLIRDGGVLGVVIRLGREFAGISVEDDCVRAGSGALDVNVAIAARDAGRTGLEFMSGIPGTVGGALRMNAGAYGGEIKDVLIEAEAVDGRGRLHRPALADFGFTYRHSTVPEDYVFLSANLRCRVGDHGEIARRIGEIDAQRRATQPRTRTGGSTFKNPSGAKAWQLIDAAGCRGLRIGGASVSEMHCNFLISGAGATAADIENLGEEVRRRVRETSGVDLEWEIIRIGVPA
jgi:UDP-N-acetylmuramate dehydrogenase